MELVLEAPLEFEELAFGGGQGAVEVRFGQAEGAAGAVGVLEQVLADAGGQAHADDVRRPLPAHAMGARSELRIGDGRRRGGRSGFLAAEFQEQMGVFDDAGELGGDDLERLDVVGGEIVPLGILDGDDADRIHLAQDGHGQEGDELLFAAAGNVLVVGVVGGARLADRPHFLEGRAGDALADLQAEAADEVGVQALVGAQDEVLGLGLVEIDRADGGAHVPGDGGHGLGQKRVEAGLEIEETDQFADVAHQRDVVFLEIAHVRFISGPARRFRRQGLTSRPKKVPFSRFRHRLPDGVTVAQQPLELFV